MGATLSALRTARAASRARAPAHRFVPATPALSPPLLAPRLRARPAPFPLEGADVRRFYFARNAVWLGARVLGLVGREVIVPAYHHGVEMEALEAAGATLRFARVDAGMRLDLDDVEASIGPHTGALYVIHYLGFPQPMDDVLALARRHGLPVIEDCALALLSKDGDVPLGARGDLAVFCLYKTVPVPNGGMLVLNGSADAPGPRRGAPLFSTLHHVSRLLLMRLARIGPGGEALRNVLRRGGRAARAATGLRTVSTGTMHFDPACVDLGMSAVTRLVLENLDFDAIVELRRRNWYLLLARLRDLAPPVYADLPAGVCPLFYPLLCPDKGVVAARLAARGIETIDFWREGHPACPRGAYPEVDELRRRVLEIPLHQDLDPDDMAYVAQNVEEALS